MHRISIDTCMTTRENLYTCLMTDRINLDATPYIYIFIFKILNHIETHLDTCMKTLF